MIVASTMIQAVFTILSSLLTIYTFVVIARCLISWVSPDPYNPIVRTLYALTEPAMWRIRKYLPFTYINGLDLSPVVLIILVYFAKQLIVALKLQLFMAMGM